VRWPCGEFEFPDRIVEAAHGNEGHAELEIYAVVSGLISSARRNLAIARSRCLTDLVTNASLGGINPTAINDRGQVVGRCGRRACLWERGTTVDLGALAADRESSAGDINNRGEIVGWSETASGRIHAVRWNGGRIEDLDPRPDGFSEAVAVNARGDIVGSDNAQAVVWWNHQPPAGRR